MQQEETSKRYLTKSTVKGMRIFVQKVCGLNPKVHKSYEECVEAFMEYFKQEDGVSEPDRALIEFILSAGLE